MLPDLTAEERQALRSWILSNISIGCLRPHEAGIGCNSGIRVFGEPTGAACLCQCHSNPSPNISNTVLVMHGIYIGVMGDIPKPWLDSLR